MKKLSRKLWDSWWFLISVIIGLPLICFTLFIALSTNDEPNSTAETTTKYFYPNDYLPLPEYPAISIPKYSTFDFSIEQDAPVTADPFQEGTYYVTYYSRLVSNNHVGNEWSSGLMYDGEFISHGSYIHPSDSLPFELTACVTENDSNKDFGLTRVSFSSLDVGDEDTRDVTVLVRENKGQYAGNVAKWSFTITVKRIS